MTNRQLFFAPHPALCHIVNNIMIGHVITNESIRFLTPEIAVVYTEETLFADKDYEVPFRKYKMGETDYKMLTDVFIKTKGVWKITAAQLTLMNQMVSPHSSSEKH